MLAKLYNLVIERGAELAAVKPPTRAEKTAAACRSSTQRSAVSVMERLAPRGD